MATINPELFESLKATCDKLHLAGTMSEGTLDEIYRRASTRDIKHSLETGSGASTLLFSHFSPDHIVFAVDDGNGSIANARKSPLMNPASVTFVEGPTQRTMPAYQFDRRFQLAMIDGPHGYPFPDLEYYYIYPHLDEGALLIIDDIHIRSIHKLFSFVRADSMFELEGVYKTTAFFTRTAAPLFDPFADGWWEQRYNKMPAWPFLLRATARKALSAFRGARNGAAARLGMPAGAAPLE